MTRRWTIAPVVFLAVTALTSACGTRVEPDRPGQAAAANTPTTAAADTAAPETFAAAAEDGSAVNAVRLPSAASPGRDGSPTRARDAVAAAPGTASEPAAAGRAPKPGGEATRGSAPSVGPGSGSGKGTAPAGPAVVDHTPVVLASVSTTSGPAGNALAPGVEGVQVWVKMINARGGLHGHPVQYLVYDDGGDPARHKALVQDAVERRGAVAFVSNMEALSGQSSVSYITEKRIPVIGVSGAEPWVYTSPMYFPQAATGDAYYATFPAAFANVMIPQGITKMATMLCVETSQCGLTEQVFSDGQKEFGYELVYRARITLSQPDFTAECLSARNSGAQFVFIVGDSNTIDRIAASCARQSYRPRYGWVSQAQVERQKDNANLDGALAISSTFPYFHTGTPAADEFAQAMRVYGTRAPTGSHTLGWVAAKLLEKATSTLPPTGPLTSPTILNGLWGIAGDDIGGLTAPLRFTRDAPPPRVPCWFNLVVTHRTWVSPDGVQLHCR